MKNHFLFGYAGNKREEVEQIYTSINFDNIKTIIEPFCGSSAMSYYISTLHPKKYKYVLNDNNKLLIEMYNILKDEAKTKDFEKIINDKAKKIINKETYKEEIKNATTNIYDWYISNKIYSIRSGLYNLKYIYSYIAIDAPIVNFLRTEDVTITSVEGVQVLKDNNNKNCLMFIDPPYLMSCNSYYAELKGENIYEYVCYNNIKKFKSKIIIVIAKNWIIDLLFKDIKNKIEYAKRYQNLTHKQVVHIIVRNFDKVNIEVINNN